MWIQFSLSWQQHSNLGYVLIAVPYNTLLFAISCSKGKVQYHVKVDNPYSCSKTLLFHLVINRWIKHHFQTFFRLRFFCESIRKAVKKHPTPLNFRKIIWYVANNLIQRGLKNFIAVFSKLICFALFYVRTGVYC